MQTERVTILMSPERKAAFDAMANDRGESLGEFLRQAGDKLAAEEADKEVELAALTGQLEEAIPRMRADLAAMRDAVRAARSVIAECRAERSKREAA